MVRLLEVGSLVKRGLSRGNTNVCLLHSKHRFRDDYPTGQCIQHEASTIMHLSDKSHQS